MNSESETYGQILKMNVNATTKESKETMGGDLSIDKVQINQIDIGDNGKKEVEKMPTPTEISMKNKLSDFYNIEQGNINISIQGG